VSAAIGVFALWPILFYEPGIDLALRMPGAIGLIAIIIIVLNICIEYWVAIRWCGVFLELVPFCGMWLQPTS